LTTRPSRAGGISLQCVWAIRASALTWRFPACSKLGLIRDTYLDDKLRLSDEEIVSLSPLRLPVVPKPLAIAYGTAELPPLVSDSLDLHAYRVAAHASGVLIPVPGANHFTVVHELRDGDGLLTRQLQLLA